MPVTPVPSYVVAGVARQGRAGLAERRHQQQLTGQHLGDEVGLQRLGARTDERQQAAREGLPHREVRRAPADLVQQHGDLGHAQALTAVLLRGGQRQQPGLLEGAPRPVATVEHVADDGAHLVKHRVHADPQSFEWQPSRAKL